MDPQQNDSSSISNSSTSLPGFGWKTYLFCGIALALWLGLGLSDVSAYEVCVLPLNLSDSGRLLAGILVFLVITDRLVLMITLVIVIRVSSNRAHIIPEDYDDKLRYASEAEAEIERLRECLDHLGQRYWKIPKSNDNIRKAVSVLDSEGGAAKNVAKRIRYIFDMLQGGEERGRG